MKKMYQIVCPSCRGLGWIPTLYPASSSAFVTCPACFGNKTVECVEETNDEQDEETSTAA